MTEIFPTYLYGTMCEYSKFDYPRELTFLKGLRIAKMKMNI